MTMERLHESFTECSITQWRKRREGHLGPDGISKKKKLQSSTQRQKGTEKTLKNTRKPEESSTAPTQDKKGRTTKKRKHKKNAPKKARPKKGEHGAQHPETKKDRKTEEKTQTKTHPKSPTKKRAARCPAPRKKGTEKHSKNKRLRNPARSP